MAVMKWILAVILIIPSLITRPQNPESHFHTNTVWNLKSSIKYDAFCLVNTLMGDPFYVKYYRSEYIEWEPKFTAKVKESLKGLRRFKDEKGLIISASLCSWFHQLQDSSLPGILKVLNDKSKVKRLLNNDYHYYLYSKMQRDLLNIIQFLIENDFEAKYKSLVLPTVNNRIDSLQVLLKDYNVVPQIEKVVGIPLKSDTITFYMVKYAKPHGINLSSNAFVSDISYDLFTSVRVAIHEMLHPYFNDNNFQIKEEIATLSRDTFIYNSFINHDKSFGYNDFDGYINESIVRVLEQIISEKFNLITDRVAHWKIEDKGMHVFAAILYSRISSNNFPGTYTSFKQFLLESIAEIHKVGGKAIYDKLYN